MENYNTFMDDIVLLSISAGVLTKDNTLENREKFKKDFIGLAEKHRSDKLLAQDYKTKFITELLDQKDFNHPEIARWATRDLAKRILKTTPKKLHCVCPEMSLDVSEAKSTGGEINREAGKGVVPIGGCVCETFDHSITMILDALTMWPSS